MKVSVIMPAYNAAAYIEAAISSVLAQTYSDLEIIVVDDGSVDNTLEILDSITDPRLKVIHTENHGVSAARNTALDIVQTDYVAYLDADDLWVEDKLERQMEMFIAEPALGLVFSDFVRFDDASPLVMMRTLFDYIPELSRIPHRATRCRHGVVITGDTFTSLVPTSEMATWVQTCVLKTHLVKQIRFPVGVSLCEDLLYMLRVYLCVNAGYINEPLVKVRRHGANSYHSADEMLEPRLHALRAIKTESLTKEQRDALMKKVAYSLASLARYHFFLGSGWKSAAANIELLSYNDGKKMVNLVRLLALPFMSVVKFFRRLYYR